MDDRQQNQRGAVGRQISAPLCAVASATDASDIYSQIHSREQRAERAVSAYAALASLRGVACGAHAHGWARSTVRVERTGPPDVNGLPLRVRR